MTNISIILGEKLRALRQQKGMSLGQLAKQLNVSRSTVCLYENDERLPSLPVFAEICRVFHVSADYFLDLHVDNCIRIPAKYLTESQVTTLLNIAAEFRKANRGE